MEKKKQKSVRGYAVVLSKTLSSLYRPVVGFYSSYSIFPSRKLAKYWLENHTTQDGKIIPVIISPLPLSR